MKRKYCKYCKERLTRIENSNIYASCFLCNTDYYTSGTINIYSEINGRIYYMQYLKPPNIHCAARIIEDINGETIAEFTTKPNVTPSNIASKLKLYLTFS